MKYHGNYKIKCECGYEGMSYQYSDELECPECETSDKTSLIPVEEWTSDDIYNTWSNELEDENYHSMTSMPYSIYSILKKHIEDEDLIKKILYDMYKDGLRN